MADQRQWDIVDVSFSQLGIRVILLIVQDTLQRKVNTSDASEYARVIGCCSSRFWGAFWLLQAAVCE